MFYKQGWLPIPGLESVPADSPNCPDGCKTVRRMVKCMTNCSECGALWHLHTLSWSEPLDNSQVDEAGCASLEGGRAGGERRASPPSDESSQFWDYWLDRAEENTDGHR